MKSEVTIFENAEFGKLKNLDRKMKHGGFLYAVEYGEYVKIGCTKNPYRRMSQLRIPASNYCDVKIGRLWISKEHTNYAETEKQAHKLFNDVRKEGTELFSVCLEKAVDSILSANFSYKNEDEKIEQKSEDFLEGMKCFMVQDFTTEPEQTKVNDLVCRWYSLDDESIKSEKVFEKVEEIISEDHIIATNGDVSDLWNCMVAFQTGGQMVFLLDLVDMSDLETDFFEPKLSLLDKNEDTLCTLYEYRTWKEEYIKAFFEDNMYKMNNAMLDYMKKEVYPHITYFKKERVLSVYPILKALIEYRKVIFD